jgi:hypothetical protein
LTAHLKANALSVTLNPMPMTESLQNLVTETVNLEWSLDEARIDSILTLSISYHRNGRRGENSSQTAPSYR